MDSKSILFEKVIELISIMEENSLSFDDWTWWRDGSPCGVEIFLGVQYAKAALNGDCILTDTGIEIVKQAKVEIIEFLYENLDESDFDESKYK